MATPINPSEVQDFDQPLNTDPDYTAVHVFSTADVTATFDGAKQGDEGANFVDFSGANGTKTTKDGITLYPIDSEFGFNVTDFVGAEQKEIDGSYTEGWVGDLMIDGQQAGLVVSDAPTDTFKTPAVLGTWLTGLGDNKVKASTEHYVTMQEILSNQAFPGDPDAVYQLDDDLILLSQNEEYNGQYVSDLLNGVKIVDGAEVALVEAVQDVNQDGAIDLKDLLNPNEETIEYDIAYGEDYSVTMKDDGKLLYRWGNAVKRPNDVRIDAEMPLPDEWEEVDNFSGLKALYKITAAELVVHHTITNNPNDQVRPEDFENESAIGTLPTYEEEIIGDRIIWRTTDDYYAGNGDLYPAGTILRDTDLAAAAAASTLVEIGAVSEDIEMGFTNAWYTTMDREPFEPVLNADGTEYITGPRWRLLPDKYGQDLPGVVIPTDPSDPLPVTKDEEKYEVGAETQTVLNLLDWETPISPLELSAGWQNNSGSVSENGLNLTEDFNMAVYIKGDIKPATIYSAELLLDHEEVELFASGAAISGTAEDDFLVGIGENTFTGGDGADLFVVSYGTSVTDEITASVISDFEVGSDKIGLIGFDALAGFDVDLPEDRALIQQGVSGDDLTISVTNADGAGFTLVATLTGLAAELGVGDSIEAGEGLDILDSFLITNPGAGEPGTGDNVITGTELADSLTGTLGVDLISGLAGNDYLYGLAGDDVLDGGAGTDRLYGGEGADEFVFATGTGLDIVYDFTDGTDQIQLDGLAFADVTISDYRGTGAVIEAGMDRMILRNVDFTEITESDFIADDTLVLV